MSEYERGFVWRLGECLLDGEGWSRPRLNAWSPVYQRQRQTRPDRWKRHGTIVLVLPQNHCAPKLSCVGIPGSKSHEGASFFSHSCLVAHDMATSTLPTFPTSYSLSEAELSSPTCGFSCSAIEAIKKTARRGNAGSWGAGRSFCSLCLRDNPRGFPRRLHVRSATP